MSGEVTYNGQPLDSFLPQRTAAYIPQVRHLIVGRFPLGALIAAPSAHSLLHTQRTHCCPLLGMLTQLRRFAECRCAPVISVTSVVSLQRYMCCKSCAKTKEGTALLTKASVTLCHCTAIERSLRTNKTQAGLQNVLLTVQHDAGGRAYCQADGAGDFGLLCQMSRHRHLPRWTFSLASGTHCIAAQLQHNQRLR